jgi:starch synthase
MAGVRSVWHVTREFGGVAGSGGVKDVVRGLALASVGAGIRTTVVLPHYGSVDLPGTRELGPSFHVDLCHHDPPWARTRESVKVLQTWIQGVRLLLVRADRYLEKRTPYTYTQQDESQNPYISRGTGHWDTHQMNLLLQHAVVALVAAAGPDAPDVIHCHDGHTAVLPALMKRSGIPWNGRCVITVHNAGDGYRQEIYGLPYARRLTRLSRRELVKGQLGPAVEPLLLGGTMALCNTVSPEYAQDIRGSAFGKRLNLLGPDLVGITNGITIREYDPRDPAAAGIPVAFDPSADNLDGKRRCRAHLFRSLGEAELRGIRSHGELKMLSQAALVTHVGRLSQQKGIQSMADAIETVMDRRADWQMLCLGEGERELEDRLIGLSQRWKGRFLFLRGFSADLAPLIYAAGDFFLIPSVYEPCGLTDMYAQMMGNIPIVHAVGGLKKVQDGTTGFSYTPQDGLADSLDRALDSRRRRPQLIREIRAHGFRTVVQKSGWDSVLREHYLPLYSAAGWSS